MKTTLLVPLTTLILATAASAQGFEPSLGVLAPRTGFPAGYGDDVLFDVQPLNFAFPMGGVAAMYTHAHIQSNGVIFLTDGAPSGATTNGYSTAPATQLANLRGLAGEPPRIAPLWRNLDNLADNGGGVFFNNTIPGKFVVTWSNTVQQGTKAPVFTVQAQLIATGEVHFFYSESAVSSEATIAGVSQGNAIAAVPGVDFTAPTGNSGTTKLLYEQFPANALDLPSKFIHFARNVFGGYDQTATDCGAFNRAYGKGCYDISDSIYQYFADAAAASAALTNQSVVLTPSNGQYVVTWGGGTFVPPTSDAKFVFATPTDDGEQLVTPSMPFPTPDGPQATLRVHSNGLISWGALAQTFPDTNNYTPTAAGFLNGANAGFYAWHDYAENDTGSGRIKREESTATGETILYVTWDNVESWPLLVANSGTLQFQLNLNSGAVAMVWTTVDNNTASSYGSAHLIGYTPAGPSLDVGDLTFATALPLTTSATNVQAMLLSASPAPVSTPSLGTVVTYTTTNMPPYDPSTSSFYIGINILSLDQVPGGLELTFLGAPGCQAYVSTFNLTRAMFGVTPTQAVTFAIPAGVPAGFELYSQSVALILPGSLPNGQNEFGMTLSNGVRQRIEAF
jgi:hypothetical protein